MVGLGLEELGRIGIVHSPEAPRRMAGKNEAIYKETFPMAQSISQPVSPQSALEVQTVQLVLVGNHAAAPEVLQELSSWLSPAQTRLTLIQAMSGVSRQWLDSVPKALWEPISHWHQTIHAQRDQYRALLEQSGYRVHGDWLCDLSDLGVDDIVKEAKAQSIDLTIVVLPSTGGGMESFSVRLATHAPCSVLILKAPLQAGGKPCKILLATDGSEASYTAAKKLPRWFPSQGLEATVVTVSNPTYLEMPVIAPYVNIPAVDKAMAQNAQLILETTRGILEAEDIAVKACLSETGLPAMELLRVIHEQQPSLAVVGCHSRHGLPHWLLGSVSQRLLQSVPGNILVVR